jgi:DNA-binding NtrC family response regulator
MTDVANSLILVASANPSSWHRVKGALGEGFAVAYAVDRRGALDVLQRQKPALLVLCSRLLDADLDESLNCIQRYAPEAQVIVITNRQDGQPQMQKAHPHVVVYLDERLVPSALAALVAGLLGEKKSAVPRASWP